VTSRLARVRRPGVIAGALFFLGAASLGDAPDTRSSSEQIAAYFVDHRTSIFASAILLGGASMALLWFAAGERRRAVAANEAVAGDVAFAAAVAAAGVVTIAMSLQYATLAYVVGAEAPASAKAMFELTLVAAPILSVPLLVLIVSVAWTEHRRRGRTVRFYASVIAAVLLAPAPFSFAAQGAFSPDVQQQVVFNTLILSLIVGDVARRAD
jgi:hypothetical protein